MTTLDSRCLDAFPGWLRSLAEDARKLAALLEDPEASSVAQRGAASALNYLFKSLDLIPDGLEDLGFIDDAFVLRVTAAQVIAEDRGLADDSSGILTKLSSEAELIREFLGADYSRLESYVHQLANGSARGRSVGQILEDDAHRGRVRSRGAAMVRRLRGPELHTRHTQPSEAQIISSQALA
jgi:uncharacterized membrane protein YkvA (DUF1232 family)